MEFTTIVVCLLQERFAPRYWIFKEFEIIQSRGLKPLDGIQQKLSEFIGVFFVGKQGWKFFLLLDREKRRVNGVKFGCNKRIRLAA